MTGTATAADKGPMSAGPVVTIFADKMGTRINAARAMDLAEVERVIRTAPRAAAKGKLPLLKFATFGNVKTIKDSLRHDGNVLTVTGVEGDYDGEQMPMADAVAKLREVGVATLLYTSASHEIDDPPHSHGGPRWRVLCPLSAALTGTEAELRQGRRRWAGVLNAILGGVLKSESFTLSQSFYFGPITGRPPPTIVRLEGVCIDQLANAPAPVFPANGAAEAQPITRTADDDVGEDRSADLYGRMCRDVRRRMADYEIKAAHRWHPKVAQMAPEARERYLRHTLAKVRASLRIDEAPLAAEESEEFPLSLVHGVADFIALPLPPREAVVEGLLNTSSLAELFAWRGVGKTMLALDLAVKVARGNCEFLKWHVPKARRVLFVDGEMAGAELQERLRGFCGTRPPEQLDVMASEVFYKQFGSALNLATMEHQLKFLQLLAALQAAGRRPELIVLDNMSALCAGKDRNSATEQEPFIAYLRALRHLGYTVFYIQHAGKSGDQRGSSANEDPLDLVIKLEVPRAGRKDEDDEPPPSDTAAFRMTFTKSRGQRPQPSVLDLELVTELDGTFEWAMKVPRKPNVWLRVLEYLVDNVVQTQTAVADALGIDKSNVSGAMKVLRERKFLEAGTLAPTPSARAYVEAARRPKGGPF